MALPIIAKVVATTAGAAALGSAFEDSGDIRHHPPQQGRTQYLPIRGDGDVDGNSATDPTSTDALDGALDEINSATLDYDAAHLYSFCDDESCTKGCATTPEPPQLLIAAEKVAALFDRFEDHIGEIATTLSNFAGEQTADRLISVYAGDGTGSFSLPEAQEGADVVRAALADAVEASEVSARDALAVNRVTVQSMRNSIAEKAVNQLSAENALWMAPLAMTGVGAIAGVAVGVGKTAWDVWQSNKAEAAGPAAVEAAKPMLEAAAARNDEAVATLRQALRHWKVSPNQNAIGKLAVDSPTPPAPSTPPVSTPPTPSSALPGVGGGAGDTTPADTGKDALESLFDAPMPEMPPSMMPSGMDSGVGGMPSSGMPSMGGAPMSDPMAGLGAEPLTDPLTDDELLDEEPLEDLTEDEDDGLGEPLEDVTEGEEPVEGDTDADAEPTPEEDAEGEVEPTPEAGDVAPVEADPPVPDVTSDDTAARTADVGNGRMVTFPSEKLAQLAADLALPGNENKTLYMAASEAGYQLPPMGQDIGSQVPPALLREGDVVVNGDNQMGVFLGNGDVLMEGGEIKPLSEVANFGGENQGLFRLEEPAPATDGLNGPAQPVGDGSTSPVGGDPAVVSTPGEVTEDVGTPGVPTDTKEDDLSATDDTLAGLNMGETDNGDAGLDPSQAFPS